MSDKKNKQESLEDILDTDTSNPQAMGNHDQKEQKKSLEEFNVIDGKYRSNKEKQIAKAKELEDLLGIQEMNPYKTLNEDIFAENLESMSVSEMTSLASHVGVTPTQNTSQLRKDLMESFRLYARRHSVNVPSPPKPIIDKNSPDYDEKVRLFKDI